MESVIKETEAMEKRLVMIFGENVAKQLKDLEYFRIKCRPIKENNVQIYVPTVDKCEGYIEIGLPDDF